MSGAVIPVHCPHCGLLFQSRAFSFMGGGNVKLTLSGNKESCPRCGHMALMADGVFNIANDVLSVVTAPNITKQMLAAFGAAVTKAQKVNTPTEQLAAEVEKIDPSFGEAVRKAGANNATKVVGLLVLLAAIKSCSVDVKLDANRLIEQLTNSPPAAVVSQNPDKK